MERLIKMGELHLGHKWLIVASILMGVLLVNSIIPPITNVEIMNTLNLLVASLAACIFIGGMYLTIFHMFWFMDEKKEASE